jgi:hypothetical protein
MATAGLSPDMTDSSRIPEAENEMVTTAAPSPERTDSHHHYRLDAAHELQSLILRSVHSHLLTGVDVSVEADGVSLTGHVASWYEKQLAQETARSLAPERKIRNQLNVKLR